MLTKCRAAFLGGSLPGLLTGPPLGVGIYDRYKLHGFGLKVDFGVAGAVILAVAGGVTLMLQQKCFPDAEE